MSDIPLMWYLLPPLVVFLIFVLPLWIVFHYITKWKRMKQREPGGDHVAVDPQDLRRMRDTALRLEQRLDALERILDEKSPEWRNR